MVTTANDVIHSWSIPAFGVKQDAIPGFVRDTWFKAEHTAPSAATARAVRQGARLHADRGARGHDAEYKTWVDGKKKKWPHWPMIPTRPGPSTS
jgi:cytochrome c oxidase subunit 2